MTPDGVRVPVDRPAEEVDQGLSTEPDRPEVAPEGIDQVWTEGEHVRRNRHGSQRVAILTVQGPLPPGQRSTRGELSLANHRPDLRALGQYVAHPFPLAEVAEQLVPDTAPSHRSANLRGRHRPRVDTEGLQRPRQFPGAAGPLRGDAGARCEALGVLPHDPLGFRQEPRVSGQVVHRRSGCGHFCPGGVVRVARFNQALGTSDGVLGVGGCGQHSRWVVRQGPALGGPGPRILQRRGHPGRGPGLPGGAIGIASLPAAARTRARRPRPRQRPASTTPARASCIRRRFRSSAARTSAAARSQLGPPGPLLGRRPQVGHRLRHLAGVPRPVVRLRRPGTACTGRPAPAPPRTRPAGRTRRPSFPGPPSAGPPPPSSPDVRRLAGQDGAQDRPEAEHVGPLVDLARPPRPPAPGGMYAGVPSTTPGLRVRPRSPAERADLGELGVVPSRVGSRSAAAPALASTLARPQSMTWTSPKLPTMTFAGFRSRWMTPWAWA